MSVQYQRFLKVLEKWPVDKSKTGRDLGEQIRKHIKSLTSPITLTQEAENKISKQIDALERLSKNTYSLEYKRVHTSTATGLTAEQCKQVLSSEFLKQLNENKVKK